ncbi:PAS domain-containing protein [Halalkalirubrum salinum]|uniref:PAS domain-containing protein n=1 Tax=Halalkalirubrum salinum TaxID=2563889 RepID=UPI0010FADDAD|nr:PAS domain-containing protein [Halalkalirubrum salinum]
MSKETVPESFIIHSGMEIVYANPAFCTLVGEKSTAQFTDCSLAELLTPHHRRPFREQVARIEREDAPTLGLTVEFQTRTDTQLRGIVVSSLIEWEGTEQVQTQVFPITEVDADRRQLLYDQAMDEAPLGITITDPSQPDNPLIYVNEGFCELTGYPEAEVLGQNCRFLQGEATQEESVETLRAAVDANEPATVTVQNYRKDGSMFWNRVTIVPIHAESGTVTNWLGYQQDITTEKRYEQDLSLFKAQAEGSEKAILITDRAGTIEYVNPAFERLTGYTAAEAKGNNPRMLKSAQQDDAFYARLWKQITAGEVWEAELTNQTKHGEFFEVKQKIIPVMDENGDITNFVSIEQDVTEDVLTTQTLDVLNRVLRHNLRNALNAIDGYAELLETAEVDSETRQASVAAIRNQAESMRKIAEKTAEIRSIWDPGEDHRTWDRFDIGSVAESYRYQYPDAVITPAVGDDGEIQVRNAELYKKALDEAVENAIVHTDQSPPEVTIAVHRDPDANQLRIRVADNGPGVPAVERETIESGEETPLTHGLGVGLWVMEWITTTLGGELLIANNEPNGSVVTFRLPAPGKNIQ